MSHAPQHFLVWSEIPSRNLDAAIAFYSAVFEVEIKRDDSGPIPMAVFPAPDQMNSISGHLYEGTPAANGEGPTAHFETRGSLEDALERVRAAGGKVVSDPIPVPAGRFAYCRDLDGNSFGVFCR